MTNDTQHQVPAGQDIGAYCREIESYLCRVNGGHLVRIVGPAFVLVSSWATEGIPLRVVLHGVDRTIARLTAKGPRRRPARVEFCEADVRDAYDQWRRAVGVRVAEAHVPAAREPAASAAPRLPSLPRHLERVLVRLSTILATHALPVALRDALAATTKDVDAALDDSRGARGEARAAVLARLPAIEQAMTEAASAALPPEQRRELEAQVTRELSPYRSQLSKAALRDAEDALFGDLLRKHYALPQVRLDG